MRVTIWRNAHIHFFTILLLLLLCVEALSTATAATNNMVSTLKPCPDKPNCVSSLAQPGSDHYVEPLPLREDIATAKTALKKIIMEMPRTAVIAEDSNSLHVTFTSKIFRFVDDVQFYFDEAHKVIHVRSASRSGYYDFGVNRRRVEKISARLSSQ